MYIEERIAPHHVVEHIAAAVTRRMRRALATSAFGEMHKLFTVLNEQPGSDV
jgi:hypothetical protein